MSLESGRKREVAGPEIEKENEVILDRSELPAVYKLIYAHHDRQNNPADLDFNDGEKPDCIVLERGTMRTDEKNIKQQMTMQYELGGQYKHMIIYAAENAVPLYLVDYKKSIENEMTKGRHAFIAPALSITGLIMVTESIIRNDFSSIREQGLNRRNFLKLLGKTGAAAYLSTPMVDISSFVGDEQDEHSMARQIHKKNRTIMAKTQPWTKTAAVEGRNIIFAMLLDKLAKQLQETLYKKPNIPFVVGAGHFEIEEEIGRDPKDLKEALSKYVANKDDLQNPGSIIKVEFVKNNKDLYDIKITPQ